MIVSLLFLSVWSEAVTASAGQVASLRCCGTVDGEVGKDRYGWSKVEGSSSAGQG